MWKLGDFSHAAWSCEVCRMTCEVVTRTMKQFTLSLTENSHQVDCNSFQRWNSLERARHPSSSLAPCTFDVIKCETRFINGKDGSKSDDDLTRCNISAWKCQVVNWNLLLLEFTWCGYYVYKSEDHRSHTMSVLWWLNTLVSVKRKWKIKDN